MFDNSIVSTSITVDSSSPTYLPLNLISGKTSVDIQAQGGKIRYRFNSAPSASSGFILNDGDFLKITSVLEINAFQAIAVSGSPVLEIKANA